MSKFPTLRLGVLSSLADLKASYDADPAIFDDPDCPYDNDTIDILKKMFAPKEVEIIKEVAVKEKKGRGRPAKNQISDEEALRLEQQAMRLMKDLDELGQTADGEMKQLDTSTKLQIFKTQAQVMDKLASIRERFTNVRRVAEFQGTVMKIIEELVPEEQHPELIERLEEYR